MMASDVNWTRDLGNAFLVNQQDVMDAVQRQRRKAHDFGYLRTNGQIIVSGGPYITITPANPAFIVVPYYDPRMVFFPPRPGFVIGGAIRFGFGVTIGGFFRPWGWGYNRFDWDRHVVIINNARWRRTWVDRDRYVHPYPEIRRYPRGSKVRSGTSYTSAPSVSGRRREKGVRAWRSTAVASASTVSPPGSCGDDFVNGAESARPGLKLVSRGPRALRSGRWRIRGQFREKHRKGNGRAK
jgi:hypothetical protein